MGRFDLTDRQWERLEPLLRLTMLAAEADAFDSGEFSTQEWIELASRRVQGRPLH